MQIVKRVNVIAMSYCVGPSCFYSDKLIRDPYKVDITRTGCIPEESVADIVECVVNR